MKFKKYGLTSFLKLLKKVGSVSGVYLLGNKMSVDFVYFRPYDVSYTFSSDNLTYFDHVRTATLNWLKTFAKGSRYLVFYVEVKE